MNTSRLLPILLLGVFCTSCGQSPETHTERFFAFGTLIEIVLYDVDTDTARKLTGQLRERFRRWHTAWQPWRGDGLAAINRAIAAGRTTAVDPDLAAVLRRARNLARRSGQRFNPAIGNLVKLWGFDDATATPHAPPAARAIAELTAAQPRLEALNLSANRIASDNTQVRIDLGGFAKGVAVGRARHLLRQAGVTAAIVNAGGDLAVLGRPGQRRWRIGIRAPRGEGVLAALTIGAGEAVFTSGDYERYFTDKGRRYHHILDPVTGYPARGARAVTVVARDPALADAAVTALFVAGPKTWPEVARRLGISKVMRVDAHGGVELTAAMAQRLRFERDPAPPHQVVDLP